MLLSSAAARRRRHRAERRRCDAHPVTKRVCASPDDALALAADASVLLSYHKFRDNLADEKGAKRLLAAVLCRLGRRGYEKSEGAPARGRPRHPRGARRAARTRKRKLRFDGPRSGRLRPNDGGGRAAHGRRTGARSPADVLPCRTVALPARRGAGRPGGHENRRV